MSWNDRRWRYPKEGHRGAEVLLGKFPEDSADCLRSSRFIPTSRKLPEKLIFQEFFSSSQHSMFAFLIFLNWLGWKN